MEQRPPRALQVHNLKREILQICRPVSILSPASPHARRSLAAAAAEAASALRGRRLQLISGYFSAGGSLLFVSSSSCSRREALSIGPVAGATSATLFSSAAAQSPASAALLDFLAGESEPTTIMDAFKVTAPAGFAILEQSAGQVAWRGDKVQPMEGMVAAAQLTKATSLAELLGPNVTEAGEQVAAKFKGNPFLVNATAEDPTGQGLDVYQFDIVTNRFREVSMYALIKRGGQNVLCFVSLKTPAQLFLDSFANKEDSFRQSLAS
eukprot:CAMPEP_0178448824 /NCGR_PEP_ID=MMETSP0689_2-20121128/42205_1 /TAXON_ID=160604 /ORGANISM="Amphidinium massartii, Strain CS-259" /LENGTH=265 /DNA_ID=CAMNT_0020074065 /DNA_START=84 /DNA_END=879 /DNA_ORIENTATION=+